MTAVILTCGIFGLATPTRFHVLYSCASFNDREINMLRFQSSDHGQGQVEFAYRSYPLGAAYYIHLCLWLRDKSLISKHDTMQNDVRLLDCLIHSHGVMHIGNDKLGFRTACTMFTHFAVASFERHVLTNVSTSKTALCELVLRFIAPALLQVTSRGIR